jgi:hypothetical protein
MIAEAAPDIERAAEIFAHSEGATLARVGIDNKPGDFEYVKIAA